MKLQGYLNTIHPVLPVKDVTKAVEFYVRKLGFRPAFKDQVEKPNYAGVVRDAVEIHLQWHDAKEWEVAIDRPMLRIVTKNIDALFAEYNTRDVFHENTRLQKTPWNTREFAFYDIDGNGLTFYVDLD